MKQRIKLWIASTLTLLSFGFGGGSGAVLWIEKGLASFEECVADPSLLGIQRDEVESGSHLVTDITRTNLVVDGAIATVADGNNMVSNEAPNFSATIVDGVTAVLTGKSISLQDPSVGATAGVPSLSIARRDQKTLHTEDCSTNEGAVQLLVKRLLEVNFGANSPIELEVKQPEIPPTLEAIAFCESGNKQFNEDGTVKRGVVNPKDVGKFQINEFYHLTTANEMGIDIYTEAGNTAYAIHLYETQGTAPWKWSERCWSK